MYESDWVISSHESVGQGSLHSGGGKAFFVSNKQQRSVTRRAVSGGRDEKKNKKFRPSLFHPIPLMPRWESLLLWREILEIKLKWALDNGLGGALFVENISAYKRPSLTGLDQSGVVRSDHLCRRESCALSALRRPRPLLAVVPRFVMSGCFSSVIRRTSAFRKA